MGRASRPARTLTPAKVKAGDVVLIRYPHVKYSRWMIVDFATEHGRTPVWSGRWAFGQDAGKWTVHAASDARYTVKHPLDARRDWERLDARA